MLNKLSIFDLPKRCITESVERLICFGFVCFASNLIEFCQKLRD